MSLSIQPYPYLQSKSVPTTPRGETLQSTRETSYARGHHRSKETDRILRNSVIVTPIQTSIDTVFKAILSEDRVSDKSLHALNSLSQTQRREISERLITDAENFKTGKESVGASLVLLHPGFVANFFPEAASTIHKQDTARVFELKTHVKNNTASTQYIPTVRPDLHRDVAKKTITNADRSRIATNDSGRVFQVKEILSTSGSGNNCGLHAVFGTQVGSHVSSPKSRLELLRPLLSPSLPKPGNNVETLLALAVVDTQSNKDLASVSKKKQADFLKKVSSSTEQLQWEVVAATAEANGKSVRIWRENSEGDLKPVYESPAATQKGVPVINILHQGGSKSGHYSRLVLTEIGKPSPKKAITNGKSSPSIHASTTEVPEQDSDYEEFDGEKWVKTPGHRNPGTANSRKV